MNSIFGFMQLVGVPINTKFTSAFSHFFSMNPTRRIINLMREMKVDQSIPLENVFQLFKEESVFHRGRPEMIVMKMKVNGRNLQLFRGGKIQILGPISNEEADRMRCEIVRRLQRVPKMEKCQVSPWTITNMVASLQLPYSVNLKNIAYSNHDLSYEVELFPAALIRKWHPAHIAVFHNGKVIVTGIKSTNVLNEIYDCTQKFVSEKGLL